MENALKKSAACQSAVASQQLALRSSRSTPFFERKPVASYHHHHQHNRAHCHHQHKFSVKRVCWLDGNFSCAVGRSFSLLWFCAVIFHQCWGFDANFHAVLCIQSLLSYEKKFFSVNTSEMYLNCVSVIDLQIAWRWDERARRVNNKTKQRTFFLPVVCFLFTLPTSRYTTVEARHRRALR